MNEEWESLSGYKIKHPKFWTDLAFKIFANGMCKPNKGDLGVIVVVLYLLYCEVILQKADKEYLTFGFFYENWLVFFKSPVKTDSKQTTLTTTITITVPGEKISFIQISRLNVYSPNQDLSAPYFLEYFCMSGTASSLYSAYPVYDLTASIHST